MTGASFMGNNQFMPGGMIPVGDMKVESTSNPNAILEEGMSYVKWLKNIGMFGMIVSILVAVAWIFLAMVDDDTTFMSILPLLGSAFLYFAVSVAISGFSWVVRACVVYLNDNAKSEK